MLQRRRWMRRVAFVDVENVDVDALARVREPGLDFFRDKKSSSRAAVERRQAPVDRVVVGDRPGSMPRSLAGGDSSGRL
jgi:hypothetical protein